MSRRTVVRTLAAAILLGMLPGCAAGPKLYVNPQADMSFYKKVAVLPFANLSQDRFAGERVARAFITELVLADRFQVIEPAEKTWAPEGFRR
jgi:TolB-like protein